MHNNIGDGLLLVKMNKPKKNKTLWHDGEIINLLLIINLHDQYEELIGCWMGQGGNAFKQHCCIQRLSSSVGTCFVIK